MNKHYVVLILPISEVFKSARKGKDVEKKTWQ